MMKLTALLLTILSLHLVERTFAQTITYEGKNVPMKMVFAEIKKQTRYYVAYNTSEVDASHKVNVQAKNEPLQKFLSRFCAEQELQFRMEDNTIIISPKQKQIQPGPVPLDTGSPFITGPSAMTVHGIVRHEQGYPLEAVSIISKGTKKGTATNANGLFSMAVNKGDVLVFSFLNFATQEIRVKSDDMQVRMMVDTKPLEELIVGGNYVATKRKAEVSSVSVIDSKTLEQLPLQDIEQIFRGLATGINSIQPTAGEVSQVSYGSGAVAIRGSGGFGGIGELKVFIDGVELAGGSYWLNTIDKFSIDRIEVVKGPSAATLYGSGANGGIIMMYTKKGTTNRTSVNVSTSAGWWDSKWQSKKPFQNIHSFDISQGYKNVSYILGGDINNSETYMPDGKMNRYTIYGNVVLNVNSKLKLTLNGRHYVNNFTPNRNAFYDDSTEAYYDKPGLQKPDSTYGNITTSLVGVTASYQATERWVHNIILGWSDNGYSRNTNLTSPPLRGTTQRDKSPTIRYNNTIAIGNSTANFKANVLTGFDYNHFESNMLAEVNGNNIYRFFGEQQNTGIFGQLNPSYKNRYFLTAALRYDINPNFTPTWSPKFGFTTNFKIHSLSLKPRISWGKGITPADQGMRSPAASANPAFIYLPNPGLRPQKQEGWDYALEAFSGNRKLKFEIVYFDNILTDAFYSNTVVTPDVKYSQYINAGKITNKGWELSVDYTLKNFTVDANYTITNAKLKKPLSGTVSSNDYPQPGDQMQFIPKYAGGVTLVYHLPKLFGETDKLSLSVAAAYSSGIFSADYARYVYDVLIKNNYRPFTDNGFRGYTIQYPSIFKCNFNMEYNLVPCLSFFVQVRNIGNNTTPEYLNNQPSVGRGWLFGLKYSFSKDGEVDIKSNRKI